MKGIFGGTGGGEGTWLNQFGDSDPAFPLLGFYLSRPWSLKEVRSPDPYGGVRDAWGLPTRTSPPCMLSAKAESWTGWGGLGKGPGPGTKSPGDLLSSHLKQPVALKKTSGSTISRVTLLLPSHQPEKGMMTRSASTGRASAMSSSFSSSVDDRFQSSPAGWGRSAPHRPGSGRAQQRVPPQPAPETEPCGKVTFQAGLLDYIWRLLAPSARFPAASPGDCGF